MATVRITQHIRNHVYAALTALFDKRLKEVASSLKEEMVQNYIDHHVYGVDIYRKAEELEDLSIKKLGVPWSTSTRTVHIGYKYRRRDNSEVIYTEVVFLKAPISIPANSSYYASLEFIAEPGTELANTLVDIRKEIEQLVDERDALIKELVYGVLTQCGSLRQVLEVWPSALEFMPPDVVERHHRQATRSERKELPTVDTTIQATLLKAKLLGG